MAIKSSRKKKRLGSKNDDHHSSCSESFQHYLLNSTLHGLRYIGTCTISIFERVFFGISFLMVVLLATYFITNIYQKWTENPVIIGLDPVYTEIKDIPFPAITICNMNQVKKSFAKSRKTHQSKLMLESVCSKDEAFNNETMVVDAKWADAKEFLLKAAQSCDNMILRCRFGMKDFVCKTVFRSILTDEGLCCSFNSVHPMLLFKSFNVNEQVVKDDTEANRYKTWTPAEGYMPSNQTPYPRPVPGSGQNMGLTLILNADVDNYYCSSTSSSGFKVLLHSPIEIPVIANFGFFVGTGRETKIVISPSISKASALIRDISIDKRHCLFADEANLSYYNVYSKKNCEMECISKLTEKKCGCTLYYMPRKFDNNSIICNRKKAVCYEDVLYKISLSRNKDYSCDSCLPACFEVNYGREISTSRLGAGKFITREMIDDYFPADSIERNAAIMQIFFLENSYGGFTKTQFIGFTDFLSNIGGLLGLFMGFSVISLVEILYFISFRSYFARKRNKAEEGRQAKEESTLRKGKEIFSVKPLRCDTHRTNRETFSNKTIRQTVNSKLRSLFRTFLNLFKKEEQAPFPYCN